MWTKIDVINFALRKSGIAAGVQGTNATPDMLETALIDYEALVNEYAQQINIRPYKPESPDLNDFTGLSDQASMAMAYQLGLRILPDYMMEPTPRFEADANQTLANLRVALVDVPQLERRDDMPFGQGWKADMRYGQFYQQANVVAGSWIIGVGEVQQFTVDFGQGQMQPGEILTGYQVAKSQFAEVTDISFDGTVITYTISFTERAAGWVKFTASGDQNTVAQIKVDFDVRGSDNA